MSNFTLRVQGLCKRFHKDSPLVVNEVEFSVSPGEIFVLLGPSGCGKTTTLRLLAGLTAPEAGSIRMGESIWVEPARVVPIEQRELGLVFQDYALFPHLSVKANVGFGLRHLSKSEREERINSLLSLVQLSSLAERSVQELSGGEQQRVSLARAVARFPRLLLLDEPFGNLDASLRKELRVQLHRLFRERGMSIVLVTHEQEEALQLADRIGVMHKGRLQQVGTPQEVYLRPRNEFVAKFLGDATLLSAHAQGRVATVKGLEIPLQKEATGEVLLCLRPEHWTLTRERPTASALKGTLLEVEFRGAFYAVRVETELGEIKVVTDFRQSWKVGEEVCLHPGEAAHILERN